MTTRNKSGSSPSYLDLQQIEATYQGALSLLRTRRAEAHASAEAGEGLTLPDPIQWIEENFYLYDTAEPLTLQDCQVRPLRLAFERDASGRYRYTTVLWSWPKKCAKSTVIAAVVDYIAEHTPRASIKLVANDLKQADSRVGMYLRENIKIAQRMGK